MKKQVCISICCQVMLVAVACGWSNLNGDLTGTLPAGTYWVNGNLNVPNGSILIVEDGAVLKFDPGMEFSIHGELQAVGTNLNRVIFTSLDDNSQGETLPGSDGDPHPGDWCGIYLNGWSTSLGIGYFDWCRVSYGGATSGYSDANLYFRDSEEGYYRNSISEYSATQGLRMVDCSPLIASCQFQDNLAEGLYAVGGTDTAPIIVNCLFTGNNSHACWLDNIALTSYEGNTGSGNNTNGMVLHGTITSSQSWEMGNPEFPFVMAGDVQVNAAQTLTLLAGTVIKSFPNGELRISGILDVNGSALEQVVFTSINDDTWGGDTNADGGGTQPAPNDWRGIYVDGYSTADGHAYLEYCRVRYGGNSSGSTDANLFLYRCDSAYVANSHFELSGTEGVRIADCSPTVTSSVFANNLTHGLYAWGGADTAPQLIDNQFIGNGSHAAWLNGVILTSYAGNSGSDNGTNGIVLHGTISVTQSWQMGDPDFPFVMDGDVLVNAARTFTLPPGTVVKSYLTGELRISGTLAVNGGEFDPVVFTSIYDDSYGGDTNADADATQPAPGDWRGIYVDGYSTADGRAYLEYCRVRFAGDTGGSADANLFLFRCDSAYIANSHFDLSSLQGMRISDCSPTVTGCSFNDNLSQGLQAWGGTDTAPLLTGNQFTGNSDRAVWLNDVALTSYAGNSGSGNGTNGMVLHGSMASSHSWQMGDPAFPFVMDGAVQVYDLQTFTLPAGTVIKSYLNGELRISGTLQVNGGVLNEVVFTSINDDTYAGDTNGDADATQPAPGDWRGIYVDGYSTADGRAYLDYCRVRFAGDYGGSADANLYLYRCDDVTVTNSFFEWSGTQGLRIADCSPIITASVFDDNLSQGLRASGGTDTTPQITSNQFNRNGGYAAWLNDVVLTSYTGNGGVDNAVNGMVLHGSVTSSQSWAMSDAGFPFILDNNIAIANSQTLSLAAGTVVKSQPAAEVIVYGTLDVNGTELEPVVFTSFADDSFAGDSNGDADATLPAAGDWEGIYLYGYSTYSGNGYFEWCRVRYGGNLTGGSDNNLNFYQSDSACFYNSISEFSATTGIMSNNSAVRMRNSRLENNNSYGMHIYGPTMPDLGANDLADRGLNTVRMNDSGVYQLYNNSNQAVPAYYNHWDAETAPEIDALLYDDDENPAMGPILFDPWQIAPPAPENLVIVYDWDTGTVELSWDVVAEATGYRVYSSPQSNIGFVEDMSGVFDGTSWTSPADGGIRFYEVRAFN